jgi:hypothetical protein
MGPPDWDEIEGKIPEYTEAEKRAAARNMLIAIILLMLAAIFIVPR